MRPADRIGVARCARLIAAFFATVAVLGFSAPAMARPPGTLLGQILGGKWETLSPSERKKAMKNYREYQGLSPDEKKSVRKRYEKWKSLPKGERDRLRAVRENLRKGLLPAVSD